MNTSAAVAATDIENSADYQALLVAAAGKPERSMGESVIPAEPPVWRDVKQRALALMSDPPHVSVLVHLVKADAHVNGFSGMYQSLSILYEKLSQHWDAALPEADPDDPDDPYYERINYLREVAEDPSFLKTLQDIVLVDARGIGTFTSRDMDIASGQISGSEEEIARCQDGVIRAAFEHSEIEVLQALHDAFRGIDDLTATLDQWLDEHAGRDHGLSFAPLRKRVKSCAEKFTSFAGDRLAEQVPASQPEDEDPALHGALTNTEPVESAVPDGPSLNDRIAVCAAFDQIILYYQTNEPSSPIPVLAQRARDMVTKSFFDVLEDLVPSEKGNLPALLAILQANPLSNLLNDSYQRFVSGEIVGVSAQNPGQSDTAEIVSDATEHGLEEADTRTSSQQPMSRLPQAAGVSTDPPLHTRNEVAATLARIDSYFSQYEPASPVPLIVAEIRRLLPKQFADLIHEFNLVLNPIADATDE